MLYLTMLPSAPVPSDLTVSSLGGGPCSLDLATSSFQVPAHGSGFDGPWPKTRDPISIAARNVSFFMMVSSEHQYCSRERQWCKATENSGRVAGLHFLS